MNPPVEVIEGYAPIACYSVVLLRDMEDSDVDSTIRHPESPGEKGVNAGVDWVSFRSAYAWHEVEVRLELWQTEPEPESPGAWAVSWVTSMTVSASGTFRVWELAVGPTDEWAFRLPEPGTYGVRAYSSGKAAEADEDQDEIPPGTERFLIQFWRQS